MKKKMLGILAVVVVLVVFVGIGGPRVMNQIGGENTLTVSQLEKAVNVSQLSTAEFVYNGVAEKYKKDKPEEVESYIAYNANVKVGIDMEQVTFQIDEETKTVTPVLPEITVQIASLDEEAISYIPRNPDVALKEIIAICKEDAIREAKEAPQLYEAAEDNLKAVMEALLSPLLEGAGYSVKWEV